MKRQLGVLLVPAFLFCLSAARPMFSQGLVESEQQEQEQLSWWTQARFGMFIHWGLYSMPARHEWVRSYERISNEEYQKYFLHFNPDLFDPREWAKAGKEAGMKYFVITTKHHEGFCLWDSTFTDYKVTNTPYGKDLIKPMVQAFRDEGIRVGFYYSLIDWHHPEFTTDRFHPLRDNPERRQGDNNRDMKKYAEYVRNQVKELLTGFGTIDYLFLDFSYPGPDGKGRNDWESEKLLRMIRELQPKIIINDRLDLRDSPGGWDFVTPEQVKVQSWPERNGVKIPWETCQTFSGSWGYHRDESTWKSTQQLLTLLIESVSKGGNLLLNVGPTSRGTFDNRATRRLQEIGAWMKLHGRSIYGCTQAPAEFKVPENCLLTYNPDKKRLYVHLLVWPMGTLRLEGYAGKVKYAQLLNDGSEVQIERRTDEWASRDMSTLTLALPILKPDVAIPVIELFLD